MGFINGVRGISKGTAAGGMLVGAVAAGAVAMGPAPTAEATCISAFGIFSGGDCTSTIGSVAIAVGTGAQAHADGLLGAAFAFGTTPVAAIGAGSVGNLAVAVGDGGGAISSGYLSAAVNAGGSSFAIGGTSLADFANVAVNLNLGGISTVAAYGGAGNVAVNLLGDSSATARGFLNLASNVFTSRSDTSVGLLVPATASWAFDIFGSNNAVLAGPGPLAVAGSILQTGATITKAGPGININGFVIGGAAGEKAPAATARQTKRTGPAAATAAKTGGTTTPRSAAAAHSSNRN